MPNSADQHDSVPRQTTLSLLDYCRRQDWAGYDPYDALNSRLFNLLPVLNAKLPRLVITQALKRSPVNLRPALLVPKMQNPKGLALFLKALLKLSKLGLSPDDAAIPALAERLCALRSPEAGYWSWGYHFPWQGRNLLVPRGAPNLVSTVFAADALLDLYDHCGHARYLEIAISAADYLLDKLYWQENGPVAGFSYPSPAARSQVHNANFLGAALLCRVHNVLGLSKYLEPALKVARYSATRQRGDGSWQYGELPTQSWVDNFHTGYNLCALRRISREEGGGVFKPHMRRGIDFYRSHFFREDGAPKYFDNETYPIDVHCVAQSIITLLEFSDQDKQHAPLARSVLRWTMDNLWDKRGYFYHQKLRYCTVKIPYMRWGQAWMLLALATFLEHERKPACQQAAGPARDQAGDSLHSNSLAAPALAGASAQ